MYQKICKWCNEEIIVDKQPLFAIHVSNCGCNPRSKDTIKPFLEYTINKYGKDFIKLYKETDMTTTQQQPQQQITRTD